MIGIRKSLLLFAALVPPGISARGVATVDAEHAELSRIVKSLEAVDCASFRAQFTVAQPQLPEDVVYDIDFSVAPPAGDDSLFPCSYLIDWKIVDREGASGFSAYFAGNHYRFSGDRLQEYHAAADSVPFVPERFGARGGGVQRNAQFVNLLPVELARTLASLAADTASTVTVTTDTIVDGLKATVVEAVMTVGSETAMESEYILDPQTLFPRRLHFENSPGSISEQTVDVKYSGPDFASPCPEINEQTLIARYDDVFSRLRQTNFTLENLVGHELPAFSLPTPTRERYTRRKGDRFTAPTILAVIDPAASFAPRTVDDLRAAVNSLPFGANLILAFTSNNADKIAEVAGENLQPGETVLQSARGLARDLGAATLPVVLMLDTDGILRDIIAGYNNGFASDVIQKMVLLNE